MRRPVGRAVAIGNGAFAAAMVVVLAAVALVVSPPAPPGIAEFAPNATKPISKAPLGQSAVSAQGAGGSCAGTSSCPPTGRPSPSPGGAGEASAIAKLTGVASALQCYTWPDGSVTQTFDPQSPPCIAGWDAAKGNGGATTPGVTGSEIRVAVPELGSGLTPLQIATANFFNSHFTFYGRKIRLLPVDESEAFVGAHGDPSPSGYRAVARKVIAARAFASTAGILEPPITPFAEELAKSHVLSVTAAVSFITTKQQQRLAPYAWGYLPALDTVEQNLASLACSALVGHPAVHGGADVSAATRKFALLLYDTDTLDTSALTDGMAACGSSPRVVRLKTENATPGDPATTQQFLQLKTDGYTSLITPHLGWSTFDALYATNAGYTPEWIVAGIGDQAAEGQFTSQGQRQQLANAYGLGTWNKLLPWSQEPWSEAASAAGYQPVSGQADQSGGQNFYHSLLVLASGIQMAGPRLTPASFESGLRSTTFANPGAGSAPVFQAGVDAHDGYTFVHDIGLVWWNQNARDYSTSPSGADGGGWCYYGRGRRFAEGSWPKTDPPMNKTGACG